MSAARDLPRGLGDMDTSLYLLCKAIREHSTVALSGESADELFGGYKQFHDARIQQADKYPWLAMDDGLTTGPDTILEPGVTAVLDLYHPRVAF
jgi:asparagine synthase (glutamine-hydrolysing)